MTTTTVHNIEPQELARLVAEHLAQQPGGIAEAAITADELPDLSAGDAARYLGCSTAHLLTIVQRWPEHLKPITAPGKATRYPTKGLLVVKSQGLTYKKP